MQRFQIEFFFTGFSFEKTARILKRLEYVQTIWKIGTFIYKYTNLKVELMSMFFSTMFILEKKVG